MQSSRARKFGDSPAWVIPETPGYIVKPIGASCPEFEACCFQEPPQRYKKKLLGHVLTTKPGERSSRSGTEATYPSGDWAIGKPHTPKPSRIEFNLDLFKPFRSCGVAMCRTGSIEHRRRAGDELLSYVGLI
ncbi:MAG TPA: hypothetical protein VGX94_17465 [Terriglobia bacterium]|nr:hypothetical protein [Terriglobia bacterium]